MLWTIGEWSFLTRSTTRKRFTMSLTTAIAVAALNTAGGSGLVAMEAWYALSLACYTVFDVLICNVIRYVFHEVTFVDPTERLTSNYEDIHTIIA